jgi:hypothetical protein
LFGKKNNLPHHTATVVGIYNPMGNYRDKFFQQISFCNVKKWKLAVDLGASDKRTIVSV